MTHNTVTGFAFALSKPVGDSFDALFQAQGKVRTDTLCVACATQGTSEGNSLLACYIGETLSSVVRITDKCESWCSYCGTALTENTSSLD